MKLEELRELHRDAVQRMHDASKAIEDADEKSDLDALEAAFDEAEAEAERSHKNVDRHERAIEARTKNPVPELEEVKERARVEITRSEPTFRKDKGGFFQTLALARQGNPDAIERLHRNNAEVVDAAKSNALYRAISQTATAGGEFIAPTWLLDLYAPKLRAGRAFANALGTHEFVNEMGNSINLPAITTGSTQVAQTDGNAVSNTSLVTATKTAAIQTVAGGQTASYQLIDLSQVGMDEVIANDCQRAYTATFDNLLLNGTVTNAKGALNVASINAVTYTDGTPTVPELYPSLFQGKSAIEKGVFEYGTDFMVMHPSTWNWFLSALDTTNRPLALEIDASGFNATAGFDADMPQGIAGQAAGIPVVVDANMPVNLGAGTNQAPILLMSRVGLDVWEGQPTFKVADQTNIANLQYQFVLYGYYGVMSRQPSAISVVNGTGLIVQAGF